MGRQGLYIGLQYTGGGSYHYTILTLFVYFVCLNYDSYIFLVSLEILFVLSSLQTNPSRMNTNEGHVHTHTHAQHTTAQNTHKNIIKE